jgi:hypothetical protein
VPARLLSLRLSLFKSILGNRWNAFAFRAENSAGQRRRRQFPTVSDSFSVDGSVDMLQNFRSSPMPAATRRLATSRRHHRCPLLGTRSYPRFVPKTFSRSLDPQAARPASEPTSQWINDHEVFQTPPSPYRPGRRDAPSMHRDRACGWPGPPAPWTRAASAHSHAPFGTWRCPTVCEGR